MGFPYPYPLGLPKGSVRSTITMLLSINLIILMFQEEVIAENIATMVVVTLTFYFGGRMRSGTSPTPTASDDRGLRAWGLPAGTIRSILLIMYISTFIYFLDKSKSAPNYFYEILNIIFGYILGTSTNSIIKWVKGLFGKEHHEKEGVSIFAHLKAIIVVTITVLTFIFTLVSSAADSLNDAFKSLLELPLISGLSALELWILIHSIIVGFYFGDRK